MPAMRFKSIDSLDDRRVDPMPHEQEISLPAPAGCRCSADTDRSCQSPGYKIGYSARI
jgi:hypothetical protein